jgi:tetratricopeptide (TPR) repeat protein
MRDLDSQLQTLENAQLVRRADNDDAMYIFKHALTQETAYDSLLKSQRMDLHRRVAEAIEALWPERLERYAGVLAYHYANAGLEDKAFTYLVLAGNAASRDYAHQEALQFYDRALALAERLKNPALNGQVRAVYSNRGRVLEVKGNFAQALDNYHAMIAFGQQTGDVAMEADGLNHWLTTKGVIGEVPNAAQQYKRVLELAHQSGDPDLIARAQWNIGISLRFSEPDRASGYFQEALEIARSAGLRELAAYVLTDLIVALQLSGRWHLLQYALQALEEFRALDNKPMIANSLGTLAEAYFARGEIAKARACADEGLQISQAIENPWGIGYNEWALLFLDMNAGEFDKAFARADHVLSTLDTVRIPLFVGIIRLLLAQMYTELNQPRRAQEFAYAGDRDLVQFRSTVWNAWTVSVQARVSIRQGDLGQARALLGSLNQSAISENLWAGSMVTPVLLELALAEGRLGDPIDFCDNLLSSLQAAETESYAAESYFYRARIHLGRGHADRAASDLIRACEICERTEQRFLLWQVHHALAECSARRGELERARHSREQATRSLRTICGNISDPALRESFLHRPDVRSSLAGE